MIDGRKLKRELNRLTLSLCKSCARKTIGQAQREGLPCAKNWRACIAQCGEKKCAIYAVRLYTLENPFGKRVH